MSTSYWQRKLNYWKFRLTILRFDMWCACQRKRFEIACRKIQEEYQRVEKTYLEYAGRRNG